MIVRASLPVGLRVVLVAACETSIDDGNSATMFISLPLTCIFVMMLLLNVGGAVANTRFSQVVHWKNSLPACRHGCIHTRTFTPTHLLTRTQSSCAFRYVPTHKAMMVSHPATVRISSSPWLAMFSVDEASLDMEDRKNSTSHTQPRQTYTLNPKPYKP